jgi:hypothetical protein
MEAVVAVVVEVQISLVEAVADLRQVHLAELVDRAA